MCASAIAWAGFGRILYGTSIPFMENLGVPQINIRATAVIAASSSLLPHTIDVIGGVLSAETNQLPYTK